MHAYTAWLWRGMIWYGAVSSRTWPDLTVWLMYTHLLSTQTHIPCRDGPREDSKQTKTHHLTSGFPDAVSVGFGSRTQFAPVTLLVKRLSRAPFLCTPYHKINRCATLTQSNPIKHYTTSMRYYPRRTRRRRGYCVLLSIFISVITASLLRLIATHVSSRVSTP